MRNLPSIRSLFKQIFYGGSVLAAGIVIEGKYSLYKTISETSQNLYNQLPSHEEMVNSIRQASSFIVVKASECAGPLLNQASTILDNASSTIGNMVCSLGQKVISSEDPAKQCGAGLLVTGAIMITFSAVAIAMMYKYCCKRNHLNPAEVRNIRAARLAPVVRQAAGPIETVDEQLARRLQAEEIAFPDTQRALRESLVERDREVALQVHQYFIDVDRADQLGLRY